ncbi:MAG: hypothetical protein KatS3mg063_1818 [Tepidiforma sp.]|nr:MAG: hypothetical protein KatS3mg063_1818 [Tepidiforma sp.]
MRRRKAAPRPRAPALAGGASAGTAVNAAAAPVPTVEAGAPGSIRGRNTTGGASSGGPAACAATNSPAPMTISSSRSGLRKMNAIHLPTAAAARCGSRRSHASCSQSGTCTATQRLGPGASSTAAMTNRLTHAAFPSSPATSACPNRPPRLTSEKSTVPTAQRASFSPSSPHANSPRAATPAVLRASSRRSRYHPRHVATAPYSAQPASTAIPNPSVRSSASRARSSAAAPSKNATHTASKATAATAAPSRHQRRISEIPRARVRAAPRVLRREGERAGRARLFVVRAAIDLHSSAAGRKPPAGPGLGAVGRVPT